MSNSSPMKGPEWLVFLRAVLLGILLAEIWRIGLSIGTSWGRQLADDDLIGVVILVISIACAGLIAYAYQREVHLHAQRIIASRRVDLGVLVLAGAWIDHLLTPELVKFHDPLSNLDKGWSQATLTVLLAIPLSAVLRPILRTNKPDLTQVRFASDIEIVDPDQDALNVRRQAVDFADTVLTSRASSGMVFGLDGPWGVGKSSFLNIATTRWTEVADDSVIVFKFEPLRYASEPDLSERFIRDLCAGIQQKVFAPEFFPAATRYSRMLKGKTDVSILGVKLTLEPSTETVDDLLGDINNLLEEIGRRLIIIIEDLDRLEPKLVNNVLFMVRRTLKLNQATYILCYDTEQLVAGREEGSRARDFLEKFINAKLSLFVDLQSIKDFLEKDWHADAAGFQAMPPDVMLKLRQITSEVGALVSGPKAYNYIPLLGDLRKVKRFVNALLLMNLEQTDLGRSDFNHRDLIHLVLLHLCYPGLFRRIYAEETEHRCGSFSLRRGKSSSNSGLDNAPGLDEIVKDVEPPAQFLLKQLFDVETINFPPHSTNDEEVWRTRACFNFESRNLEKYLQLIVRFKVPEVTTTFKLYKDLLDEVIKGRTTITEVLERPEFAVRTNENAHDRFWRILVNNAHQLDRKSAEDSITTLVNWLPRYSMLSQGDRSLRQRSIYTLVLLLDRAGFSEPRHGRIRSSNDVVEIARRILGDGRPSPTLIQQLVAPERGPLAWEDLMLFRLTCCADRLGQMHNIYTALIRYEDQNSRVEGDLGVITLNSMRRFSQQVFQEFKQRYINTKISFFADIDGTGDAEILGASGEVADSNIDIEDALKAARSAVKSFVIYQLVNQRLNDGTGIGCGVYDEVGTGDGGSIHRAMCNYLFSFCFNPAFGLAHARAFADYCLRAFRDEEIWNPETLDVVVAATWLTNLLGQENMKAFWASSGGQIKAMLANESGTVVSYNYKASYAERLPLVFNALDHLIAVDPSVLDDSHPID
jgi:hypothetical protein